MYENPIIRRNLVEQQLDGRRREAAERRCAAEARAPRRRWRTLFFLTARP